MTQSLSDRVASFPYWYHRIELPDGVTTPGFAPHCAEAYRVPLDLTGKRVLDIGAWDGFWTFEALKRGASEVIAIEDFSDDLSPDKSRRATGWQQFDLCRDALGFGEDRCKRLDLSLYDMTPEMLGTFDLVFFFGAIYHCRYPLLALDRIAPLVHGTMIVESAILDDYSVYMGGRRGVYGNHDVVAEFYPGAQYGGVATNWWVPTLQCLLAMITAAGFSNVWGWKLTNEPEDIAVCRGFARADRGVGNAD